MYRVSYPIGAQAPKECWIFLASTGGYYQELILSAEFLNSIRSHGKG